jgi:hypothetical protein
VGLYLINKIGNDKDDRGLDISTKNPDNIRHIMALLSGTPVEQFFRHVQAIERGVVILYRDSIASSRCLKSRIDGIHNKNKQERELKIVQCFFAPAHQSE